jgi:hypothetical protein
LGLDLINSANINPYLNTSQIYVDKDVDTDFANNVIEQYQSLCQFSNGEKAKKLVILEDVKDIEKIEEEYQALAQYLKGDASIAYGIYSKKDDAICIIQNNHQRKEKEYEGDITQQGADTLTHEFAHLLDEGLSQTSLFESAFLDYIFSAIILHSTCNLILCAITITSYCIYRNFYTLFYSVM